MTHDTTMRRWMRAGSLAALAALAAACGGGDDDDGRRRPTAGADDQFGDPVSGGTAVIAELADINRPLPILAETSLDGNLGGDVMFNSLLRSSWEDGRIVYRTADESPAALASRWELLGPDSTALRYHIKPGLRWSDGQPITAHDVVWTYEMLGHPDVASPQQNYVEQMDSVTAQDDSTVTFWFKRRYPEMWFHSGIGIGPSHVFRGTSPGELRNHPALLNPENGRLPVSGSFMIGEWRRGTQFTLVPNPHFPQPARLERIVFRVIPEMTTRITELLNQTVDISRPIPFDQIPEIRSRAPFVEFEREEKRFYEYIGYNPGFEPFADPEVRRALGLAIDKEGLIGALQMEEFAVPAGGMYSPIFRELYDPQSMKPLPFDTVEAKRILDARGWVDSDNDGVRDKNGRPLRFTLVTNSGNSRRADISQIVQQMWARVGVRADLQLQETNTFFDNLREEQYQAALAGWGVALSPDISTIWRSASPFNNVAYDNPAAEAVMDSALAAPTAEAANPFWKRAAAMVVEDQPYSWLFFFDQVTGRNRRLRGVRMDTYGPYQNLWEWWIPSEFQRQRGPAAAGADTATPDTGQ